MNESDFNLSAAALKYLRDRPLLLLAIAAGGIAAYFQLGQREDLFAFRRWLTRTPRPGAPRPPDHDRIEKKLQETPADAQLFQVGESLIILEPLETAAPKDVP